MTTMFKQLLIACCIALPSLAFAADNTPEPKPVPAPQTTAVTTAPAGTVAKPAATAPAARIGYIDIERISTESDRGKALKALLMAKKEQLQEKLKAKNTQLDKLKTSIEAKIATMTQKQRETKAKDFQKKVEEFQKVVQTSENELLSLQEKESKAFYEAIEQAATEQGKAAGLAAIVVKRELLYVGAIDAQDVTDALIKTMNQKK